MTIPTIDADLEIAVRRIGRLRAGFYLVVLGTALAGQVTGATEALHIPLIAAIPAVGALELGGVVVLANADVRRRLGEHANASRLLSVAIAAWAVTFNWLAHSNHLLGGFFAGMSALGYLVWLMHTENQRRDRLRAKGDLPPTSPVYGLWCWLTSPLMTRRARALALASKPDAKLDLYDSLAAAKAEIRSERRRAAISTVLHRKIRSAVDPKTADIAIAVYDLDEIASRLAAEADYDGLTALIAADLQPAKMLAPAEIEPLKPVLVVEDEIAPYFGLDDDLDVPAGLFADDPEPAPVTPTAPVSRTRRAFPARTHHGRRSLVRHSTRRGGTSSTTPATEPPAETPEPAAEPVPAEAPAKRKPPVPDQRLLKRLRDPDAVPRRPDGTIPVRLVEDALGVGQERAIRLLKGIDAYRQGDGAPVPARVNGSVPKGEPAS